MASIAFGDSRLPARFWSKIQQLDNGCWEWTAAKSANGYAVYQHEKRCGSGHRVSYTVLVEPIPAGYQIDHLCRNRACVNPAHLEAVTCQVNLLRGETHAARGAAATHCPKNHEYSEANTRRNRKGYRSCRECGNDWQRRNGLASRQRAKARGASWA